jgi:opacity protein-like surface antigen
MWGARGRRSEELKAVKKQILILVGSLSLAGFSAFGALPAAAQNGFYGGVTLRDGSSDSLGLALNKLPLAWNRYSSPQSDELGQQGSLVFGGYRWKSDVAVEAAFNGIDNYSIGPPARSPLSGGGLGLSESAARTWNADVYTSWEFVRSLSLYGRLGYAQSDVKPVVAAALPPLDVRRLREGVNYGVGLRYDMTRALGLRVEYSRFNRYTTDGTAVGVLPESDQVTIGVQFRF